MMSSTIMVEKRRKSRVAPNRSSAFWGPLNLALVLGNFALFGLAVEGSSGSGGCLWMAGPLQ